VEADKKTVNNSSVIDGSFFNSTQFFFSLSYLILSYFDLLYSVNRESKYRSFGDPIIAGSGDNNNLT